MVGPWLMSDICPSKHLNPNKILYTHGQAPLISTITDVLEDQTPVQVS